MAKKSSSPSFAPFAYPELSQQLSQFSHPQPQTQSPAEFIKSMVAALTPVLNQKFGANWKDQGSAVTGFLGMGTGSTPDFLTRATAGGKDPISVLAKEYSQTPTSPESTIRGLPSWAQAEAKSKMSGRPTDKAGIIGSINQMTQAGVPKTEAENLLYEQLAGQKYGLVGKKANPVTQAEKYSPEVIQQQYNVSPQHMYQLASQQTNQTLQMIPQITQAQAAYEMLPAKTKAKVQDPTKGMENYLPEGLTWDQLAHDPFYQTPQGQQDILTRYLDKQLAQLDKNKALTDKIQKQLGPLANQILGPNPSEAQLLQLAQLAGGVGTSTTGTPQTVLGNLIRTTP